MFPVSSPTLYVARIYEWSGPGFSIANANRFLSVLQLTIVLSAYNL